MVVQVAIEDLDTWLGNQPENTVDTPYEIEITGITQYNKSSIRQSLYHNSNKFVDLSFTTIPNVAVDMSDFFDVCSSLVYSPAFSFGVEDLYGCFRDCTNLKEPPVIPSSVTDIGSCFQGCSSLTVAPVIPENVTSVFQTFMECTSIQNAPTIPSGVTDMEGTFRECTSLISAPNIPSGVTVLKHTFYNCSALTTPPVLPSGITNLYHTFQKCSSLINAPVIPDTVTKMEYTFANCTSLVNAPVIPNNVNTMDVTFSKCTSLAYKAILPSSIPASADCYISVTQTRWGGSTSQIDTWVASQTSEFEVLEIEADSENNYYEPTGREVYGVDISNLDTWLSEHDANTVDTPYEIKVLGYIPSVNDDRPLGTALRNNSTKFVDLSYSDFSNYSEPNAFRFIFDRCVSLVKSCNLPNGITDISAAFSSCSNLKESPNIPNTVTVMQNTFFGCSKLTETPVLPNGVLDIATTFHSCTSLKKVTNIPNTVQNMNGSFENCSSLVSVPDLPNSLANLGYALNGTFTNCISLKTAPYIPASNEKQMYGTFSGCTNLRFIPSIPNNITNMDSVFVNCKNLMAAPIIPNSVKYMPSTFVRCSKLTSGKGVTEIGVHILSNNAEIKGWANTVEDSYNGDIFYYPNMSSAIIAHTYTNQGVEGYTHTADNVLYCMLVKNIYTEEIFFAVRCKCYDIMGGEDVKTFPLKNISLSNLADFVLSNGVEHNAYWQYGTHSYVWSNEERSLHLGDSTFDSLVVGSRYWDSESGYEILYKNVSLESTLGIHYASTIQLPDGLINLEDTFYICTISMKWIVH